MEPQPQTDLQATHLEASRVLFVARAVNGRVILDVPDRPDIHEGPSRFAYQLGSEELRTLLAPLPARVVESVRALLQGHIEDLRHIDSRVKIAKITTDSRLADAAEMRGIVDGLIP